VTVAELQAALQAALERGLDPATTVVVSDREGWFTILEEVADPSVPEDDRADMWFTLFPGQGDDFVADCRFTPGGRP
jgi:uncharacterized protein (DUF1697 family)